MADEPKKDQPEDIESILSDLDAILTDAEAAPQPEEPPKANPEPVKAEPPKAVPPPPPAPKAEIAPPIETPKPPPVVIDAPKANQVELAPREGMIKPPEKKAPAEPPKPAPKLPDQKPIELSVGPSIPAPAPKPIDPPKPIEPPKAAPVPTAAPVPAPAAAPAKLEEFPADAPKEQIRRVAYVYTSACAEVKTACAAFLSQAARTISKKPLFLREVLSHEVGPASDPNVVLQKALQVKAAAILAVVEDWPPAKLDELSEACARANVLFRAVAPADAQKKSTAVDIIVDMMLLPGEG